MKLPVPYYSQYLDITDDYWKPRSCAVACVKMILDFVGAKTPSLDDLVWQGVRLDGHDPSVGWRHVALVSLMDIYGVTSERREFKHDVGFEDGLERIVGSLRSSYPVLVSVLKGFQEEGSFHMIILTGFEQEDEGVTGFYYHDPDAKTIEEGADQFVPIETFKKFWRRLAIFTKNKS